VVWPPGQPTRRADASSGNIAARYPKIAARSGAPTGASARQDPETHQGDRLSRRLRQHGRAYLFGFGRHGSAP
jgi:hypothetical protein